MANTLSAGRDYSFGDDHGARSSRNGTTDGFPDPGLRSPTAAACRHLDVTVNIFDSGDQFLGLTLVAPSGDTFTLVLNQVPVIGGSADTGIGISGGNVGVVSYTDNNIATYAMGTTFADTATRDIFDPTTAGTNGNTAPYIGDYRPEGDGAESLDHFLALELAQWHQRHLDARSPTTPNTSDHPADDTELPH